MNADQLVPQDLHDKYLLVAADMGYGHQRAIYPLKALAKNQIILNANSSPGATLKEKRLWKEMLRTYEFMSRAGKIPLLGSLISRILDSLLYIPKFYPVKDRSNSTIQVRYLKFSINKGLCNGITEEVKSSDLPLITSFYAPAIAADMAGLKSIFCIICDTDLSRVWVPEDASGSRIIYLAPGTFSAQRLQSYGVHEKNIVLTGFPLPLELLGDRSLNTLRNNLIRRLKNLDPDGSFSNLFKHSVKALLIKGSNEFNSSEAGENHITITYAVGGAGAQKEIGRQIVLSLANKIKTGQVKINLIAGTRTELRDYFFWIKKEIEDRHDNVKIVWADSNESYFDLFNQVLQTTDILWTKPSELSFYCALGIPVIMTQAIGPQEKANQRWLREIGAGIKQQNPEYTDQWLFDLLMRGRLAEAAWNGFLKARKYGTYNILDFLETGTFTSSNDPLKR
jgi:hypothetical protein